jgi:hypothetical protein
MSAFTAAFARAWTGCAGQDGIVAVTTTTVYGPAGTRTE